MSSIRCAWGLHDDRTDAFGGYSPTCVRCGGPSWGGPNLGARGWAMLLTGCGMLLLGALAHLDTGGKWSALIGGDVLILTAAIMIVIHHRDMARLTAHTPHGWWDCPTCGRTRLEPHPRQPLLRCSNCKEHRR